MSYLAVDKNGNEYVYLNKPIRKGDEWDVQKGDNYLNAKYLTNGTIRDKLGKQLCWEDEPVEIKD